jgi:hypothetical protein
MRPRMIPMDLDEAIKIYVINKGPTFVCGPVSRPTFNSIRFCFSRKKNSFHSVEAHVEKGSVSRSMLAIEKLEDDLYDEAVLQFNIKLAELDGDHSRAGALVLYGEAARKLG